MEARPLIFLLLFLFLFVAISFASSQGTVTIELNATKVWWNDSVSASGVARYANGTGISGDVCIEVDGNNYDCPSTTDGNWSCVFNAPTKIGLYTVKVNITNSTGFVFQNSTSLTVSPFYGKSPLGTVDRIVYELPMLIQDMNGEIRVVLARIMVWKG
jgi:hypothetical protein